MLVAKITAEKATELKDKEYQNGALFNPVKDNTGEWIVSLVEAQFLQIGDFEVVEFTPIESDEEL